MRLVGALAVALVLSVGLIATPVYAQSSGRYGGVSRETRAKIDALGDTAVQNLPIPILFGIEVVNLTKNFGDPRGGGTRTHEGLDMLASAGTPIASPTDAVVTRVGNGGSSGLYVRTANPGGETFVYMHLGAHVRDLAAGSVLKRGDVIGFVGNTGNASGGPAHLHFEIRKGGATDPFPRLTEVFTLAERMEGVRQALERSDDPALAETLAKRYESIFLAAQAQGIPIPEAIVPHLAAAPAEPPPTPDTPAPPSAASSVIFGESNADIVVLQKFLISANAGSASAYLSRSGATGYFGPITQAALIEYQRSAGLEPSGILDEATYTQIFALAGEGDSSETEPEDGEKPETPTSGDSPGNIFTRDLEEGMEGADVLALQRFLNAQGFTLADSGAGAPGAETDYFGSRTRSALAQFQKAHGIKPAVGYFGPITRMFLTKII